MSIVRTDNDRAGRATSVGVRERLNRNRIVAGIAAAVVILAGVGAGLWQAFGGRPEVRRTTQRAYFSADDGHSWFPDDASKLPPIEHEGKTAYRARVFRCPDGKEFVSHLERYAPADKKRLEESKSAPDGANAMVMEQTTFIQIGEVKKPGDSQWIRLTRETSEQYQRITQPKCPDGGSTDVQPVLPP
jgi:hypothetical protein